MTALQLRIMPSQGPVETSDVNKALLYNCFRNYKPNTKLQKKSAGLLPAKMKCVPQTQREGYGQVLKNIEVIETRAYARWEQEHNETNGHEN